MAGPPPLVAIINTNDDLVRVLREELIGKGLLVVTGHIREFKAGAQDFGTFVSAHNPAAIIYDITVPYEESWTFFRMLQRLPEAADRQFVITTVNKRVLDQRIGPNEAIEIQGGRADDLDPVVEAVLRVVRP